MEFHSVNFNDYTDVKGKGIGMIGKIKRSILGLFFIFNGS